MRQKEKTILLLLAVMAIGMFALPSTLAMYTGQHDFVNGSNVNCTRCHGAGDAIYEEINGSDMHTQFSCRDCHGYSGVYNTVTPNTNNSTGHAGTLGVMCLDCHTDGTTIAATLLTDDMDTNGVSITDEFNMSTAAHNDMFDFYNQASEDLDLMCIACHTTVTLNLGTGNISVNNTAYNILNLSDFTYGEDQW